MTVVNSNQIKGHTAAGGRVTRILLDHEIGLEDAAVVQVDFADGTASEFHARDGQTEIVYCLKGTSAIGYPDGRREEMPEGGAMYIPASVEHRHENGGTPMATVLVIFIPPKNITDAVRKRPLED